MERSAVALGLFDGVHSGHRAVLELALEEAENGLMPRVFTFSPDTVLRKKSGADGYIYDHPRKLSLLSEYGEVFSADFSVVRSLTGEEFARQYLRDMLNAGAVCCGRDFRFGRGASCGVDELRELGVSYGFTVKTAEDVMIDGIVVSSGEIRRCLSEGDILRANRLLGRPYTIQKEVVHGAHLGSTIGFPTINQLYAEGQLVPRYGVYASRVTIGEEQYRAVTNIGMKPTVNYGGVPLAETHIIGFSGDLYGMTLETELTGFIRPEQRFGSIDELKARIAEDLNSFN